MIKNYILSYFRQLKTSPVNGLINIIGLSTGLCLFILIGYYISFELSYDKFNPQSNSIYRVLRKSKSDSKYYLTPEPLAEVLKSEYSGIERTSRVLQDHFGLLLKSGQKSIYSKSVTAIDPDGIQIFDFQFINAEKVNLEPYSVIISRSEAIKHFGTTDVQGKVLEVDLFEKNKAFSIVGVFEDYPENSHLNFNIVFHFSTFLQSYNPNSTGNWQNINYHLYTQINSLANAKNIEIQLPNLIAKYEGIPVEDQKIEYIFQNIIDAHLDSKGLFFKPYNTLSRLVLIGLLGSFILFIACSNYANLTTARALQRAKEVGLRKVSGARQLGLIILFLTESCITVIISLIVSTVLIYLSLPAFNEIMDSSLEIGLSANKELYIICVIAIILATLLSGIYPAILISRFSPAKTLKGSFSRSVEGRTARDILVIIQFVISATLIVCTFTIKDQITYLNKIDPGYNKEQIVTVHILNPEWRKPFLKNELSNIPGINKVSLSSSLPHNAMGSMGRNLRDENGEFPYSFSVIVADHDFLDLYGIELLSGRNFSEDYNDKNSYLINEQGVKMLGLTDPVGKSYIESNSDTVKIIGVVKDFNFKSLKSNIQPFRFISTDTWPTWLNYYSIKINQKDSHKTLAEIQNTFDKYSDGYPFDFAFFDDQFNELYQSEIKLSNIIEVFTFFALLVACLGLYGLVLSIINIKLKEVGVRKVLGANTKTLILTLSSSFNKTVLAGVLLGVVASCIIMNQWLANFAYHVSIDPLLLIQSILVILFLVWLTISYQIIKVTKINPAQILRNE